MSENTTRLQATGGNVNYWSHQLFGHVRKYSKIPGKPPIIVQCVKIQRDCRQRGKIFSNWSHQWFGNVSKYNKIAGNAENILIIDATRYFALFETTTRLQATEANFNNWSHQWVGNVWKYNKIAGKRENLSDWSHQWFSYNPFFWPRHPCFWPCPKNPKWEWPLNQTRDLGEKVVRGHEAPKLPKTPNQRVLSCFSVVFWKSNVRT